MPVNKHINKYEYVDMIVSLSVWLHVVVKSRTFIAHDHLRASRSVYLLNKNYRAIHGVGFKEFVGSRWLFPKGFRRTCVALRNTPEDGRA